MALTIDAARCPQNHSCPLLKVCPVEAITQDEYKLPNINPDKCIECGKCVKSCGMKAVSEQDRGKTV